MNNIHDDFVLRPVPDTWWEPAPGTTAWRIRQAVRWAVALGFGFACLAYLIVIDLVSPVGR